MHKSTDISIKEIGSYAEHTRETLCQVSFTQHQEVRKLEGLRGLLGEGRLRKDKMCLHTGDTVLGTSVLESRTESQCGLAMRGAHTG